MAFRSARLSEELNHGQSMLGGGLWVGRQVESTLPGNRQNTYGYSPITGEATTFTSADGSTLTRTFDGPLVTVCTYGGATVVCPLHDRAYDLRTGTGLHGECTSLEVYPVALRQDGKIWLTVSG